MHLKEQFGLYFCVNCFGVSRFDNCQHNSSECRMNQFQLCMFDSFQKLALEKSHKQTT